MKSVNTILKIAGNVVLVGLLEILSLQGAASTQQQNILPFQIQIGSKTVSCAISQNRIIAGEQNEINGNFVAFASEIREIKAKIKRTNKSNKISLKRKLATLIKLSKAADSACRHPVEIAATAPVSTTLETTPAINLSNFTSDAAAALPSGCQSNKTNFISGLVNGTCTLFDFGISGARSDWNDSFGGHTNVTGFVDTGSPYSSTAFTLSFLGKNAGTFTCAIGSLFPHAQYIDETNEFFLAGPNSGSCSIQVAEYGGIGGRIRGTFSATLVGSVSTLNITDGKFDVAAPNNLPQLPIAPSMTEYSRIMNGHPLLFGDMSITTDKANFSVTLRDANGTPEVGRLVVIDFSNSTNVHLSEDLLNPSSLDCASHRYFARTGVDGRANFRLKFGGYENNPIISIDAYVDGGVLPLAKATARSFDLDGWGGVGMNDLSLWLGAYQNLANGVLIDQPEADLDLNGFIGINDMSVLMHAFGEASSANYCGDISIL